MTGPRYVVSCWTEHEHEDFDKCEHFHYDIVEASTGAIFMRFSGSYDQPYGCDPEYEGVGLVRVDAAGDHAIVVRGYGRHTDFRLDPPERVKIRELRPPMPRGRYLDRVPVFAGLVSIAEAAAQSVRGLLS